MNDFQLIQVFTKDQLKLNGLYSSGDKTNNFYSHDFYHTLADKLKKIRWFLVKGPSSSIKGGWYTGLEPATSAFTEQRSNQLS